MNTIIPFDFIGSADSDTPADPAAAAQYATPIGANAPGGYVTTLAAATGPTIASDAFTQQLQAIGQLIDQGQLQQAALALNEAQKQHPKDARVALVGVRLAERAGNLPGAVQAARRAVALEPGWHVAVMELALALMRAGENAEAMEQARLAVALDANNPEVLRRAVQVARQTGHPDYALPWTGNLLQHFPDDNNLRLRYAYLLKTNKQADKAREQFQQVLQADPESTDALWGLFSCALTGDDKEEARRLIDILIIRMPDDENTRYWHAIAHDQTPPSQPNDVISSLFDDYAPRFDFHLVGGLQYKTPERVARLLLEIHPDRRFNVLDLGCGTGLLGVYLGPVNGHLIGVDLSEKMIQQAARHGVYSRFHRVNMLDALRDTPSDLYEVITCLDALVYAGDLAPIAPNAFCILKVGGHFIFTCETAAEDEEADLILRPGSNRYAHKASAAERICREAGFDDVRIEHMPRLRSEGGKDLPGFLVIARKPAAAAA